MRGQVIRINFQLPVGLAEGFGREAKALGVTKSNLLRSWLLNTQDFPIIQPRDKTSALVTYNMRLEEHTHSILEYRARLSGITKSSYLRSLITYRLTGKTIKQTSLVLKETGRKVYTTWDRYREVHTNLESAGIQELIWFVKENIELGALNIASQALDVMERRLIGVSRDHATFVPVDYFRALIARHERHLETAKKLFTKALDNCIKNDLYELLSPIYVQLGVIADITDDFHEAVRLTEKSLEYMRVQDMPREYIKGYTRLASLHSQSKSWGVVEGYQVKIQEVVDKYIGEDKRLSAQLLNRKSVNTIRAGDLQLAQEMIKVVLKAPEIAASSKEQRYNYENMAIIAMVMGDTAMAREYMGMSDSLENAFRGHSGMGKLKFFQLFELASRDYKSASHQMESEIMFKKDVVYRAIGEYVYFAMQYIYATPLSLRESGERGLLRVGANAPTLLLRDAAHHTLKHRWLAPVV